MLAKRRALAGVDIVAMGQAAIAAVEVDAPVTAVERGAIRRPVGAAGWRPPSAIHLNVGSLVAAPVSVSALAVSSR
jgi:hypothetical protein